MNYEVWITIAFAILAALSGALWKLVTGQIKKLDDKMDRLSEKFDTSSLGVLMEKVIQLELHRNRVERFLDEHFPKRLDEITSDVYGTISKTENELKNRLDVLEKTARGMQW